MDRLKTITSALLLMNIIGFQAAAKDVTVYRWVDKNGQIHFSQHEPIDKEYAEVTIETPYNKPKPSLPDRKIKEGDSPEVVSAKLAMQAEEKCENAKSNLRTLNDFPKVKVTGEDGKTRVLTPLEKLQQLRLAENEVAVYCDKSLTN
ncbi:DUF4124 domain-containing protein [Thalassotalea mangrovi]|uniref:DUF4124 domain-containing protein n=1 Tax=Thalassotalea mangrovi TaxID=2572245 RepID=A0A4V5NWL1_9GAMM|nr:DUF4124 domain-containing protein [Thalassotalea mangrovi]TKB44267.1 DUF4124 domain-containing protein [Thalassotalea mangrovi]